MGFPCIRHAMSWKDLQRFIVTDQKCIQIENIFVDAPDPIYKRIQPYGCAGTNLQEIYRRGRFIQKCMLCPPMKFYRPNLCLPFSFSEGAWAFNFHFLWCSFPKWRSPIGFGLFCLHIIHAITFGKLVVIGERERDLDISAL